MPHLGKEAFSTLAKAEVAIDRFEHAWQERAGGTPLIRDYCDVEIEARAALLLELVLIDIEYRFKAGEAPSVDKYLTDLPELQSDEDALVLLIAAVSRWRQSTTPPKDSAEDSNCADRQPSISTRTSDHSKLSNELPSNRVVGTSSVASADDGKSTNALPDKESNAVERPPPHSGPPQLVELARYRIMEPLGEGAFGSVYRAFDTELGRSVAVKIPRSGFFDSSEERERFLREARSAASLSHLNIVPIYDVGSRNDIPFIVSALVNGQTLAKRLGTGPLDVREAAAIVAIVADALHYAHERQVVHRDVKPSNIMVDAGGRPFLMDFGLAKSDRGDVALTMEGQLLGTPAYMSPEQALGEIGRIDARSDTYSLGVVLYEMLTGERPFRGNVRMLIDQVVNEEPRSPLALNDRISRDLATICLKCMQKSAVRRYQSAAELAADLRRFLVGEAIHARPVTRFERSWRWVRRNPRTTALLGTILTLMLSLSVVSIIAAIRIDAARRVSDENVTRTTLANERAQQAFQESIARLERLYVANGNALIEAGNPANALPWFSAAVRSQDASAVRWPVHRVRMAATIRALPQLAHLWMHRSAVVQVQRNPSRELLAIASTEGTVTLRDLEKPQENPRVLQCGSPVSQCVFTNDGMRIATLSFDGNVGVWSVSDLEDRPQQLHRFGTPTQISVSPDAKLVAAACRDGIARLWDPESGGTVALTPRHNGKVNQVAFNRDGTLLATVGEDALARIWATETGDVVGEVQHGAPVKWVCFSPDNSSLVTVTHDGTVQVWDVATRAIRRVLQQDCGVSAIAISGSKSLILGCVDGQLRVLDLESDMQSQLLKGHTGRILHISVSPDGGRCATGSDDNTARVWNLETGEQMYPPFVHAEAVPAAELINDGQMLVTGSFDGAVKVWKLGTPYQSEIVVAGVEPVESVQCSHDERLLLTGARSGAHLCCLDSGDVITVAEGRKIRQADLADQGGRVAVTFDEGGSEIWDASSKTTLDSFHLDDGPITSAVFSSNAELLATSTAKNGRIRVWNLTSKTPAGEFHHGTPVVKIDFSITGDQIFSLAGDGSIKVWDVSSGLLGLQTQKGAADQKCSLFSPDGRLFLTSNRESVAQVWDASSGALVRQIQDRPFILNAVFSPDGTRLALASASDVARVWSVTTGSPVTGLLRHARDVTCCAFSPDGQLLATGSADKRVRLWDASTGEPVCPYLQHTDDVLFVGFHADGTQLVTVSTDGHVRVWTLGDSLTSPELLARLARLYSGFEIDETGSPTPVAKLKLEKDWLELDRNACDLLWRNQP
jgi:WD40 repeat protein/tRNA A-37 threonylcarbamoyl transferase component Bud32